MTSLLGIELHAVRVTQPSSAGGALLVSVEIYHIGSNSSGAMATQNGTKAAAPSGGWAGVKLMVQGGWTIRPTTTLRRFRSPAVRNISPRPDS